jgi:tight adherence protein B
MGIEQEVSQTKLMFYGVLALAAIAAMLAAVLLRKGVEGYQRQFVTNVTAGLKQNFLIADPRALFLISVLLTVLLGGLGYWVFDVPGAVIATVIAIVAPRMVLNRITRKRSEQFVYQLPDALLALSSTLRAGSNMAKGLELLATRQPAPLCQEFMIVLGENRIGRQLPDSLTDMRNRIGAPELDMMNTAINLARKVGGNLADTLETLAKTLQDKAQIEGKIKALTSMGKMQGWVVSGVPVFVGGMVYLQQPQQMIRLFTEWYGWVTLAVIAVLMAMAVFFIRKIVDIDV